MNLTVTGGAGFIGSHVVDAALADGHQVVVVDTAPVASTRVRQVVGDVRDAATCDEAVRDADVVLHLAAKVGMDQAVGDMPDYVANNDLGTAVLLAAMARARCERLVLASSMVVYGEGAYRCAEHGSQVPAPRRQGDLQVGRFEPPCRLCGRPLEPVLVDEDAPLAPTSAYASSKVAQEHLAGVWARHTGGTAVALRFHNVYGPGLPVGTPYAGVAALFRSALLDGRPPRVFEDGGQRRDFVHVRDVAAAVLTGTTARLHSGTMRPFNVGSGRVRTVLDVAAALAEALQGPAPVVTGEHRASDVRHITASSRRIADELGWRAGIELEDGMRELALTTAAAAGARRRAP